MGRTDITLELHPDSPYDRAGGHVAGAVFSMTGVRSARGFGR